MGRVFHSKKNQMEWQKQVYVDGTYFQEHFFGSTFRYFSVVRCLFNLCRRKIRFKAWNIKKIPIYGLWECNIAFGHALCIFSGSFYPAVS